MPHPSTGETSTLPPHPGQEPVPAASINTHNVSAAGVSHLRLFLAILLLMPMLCLAICFGIMRSKWFFHHTHGLYLVNLGYGMTLHDTDCQVLIYGDSSALVGVDPAIIQAQTGLSTCNIAEFAGMTMINGTMILDGFLAHNPRPRYILFLFTPEDLAPYPKWQYVGTYEGILARVRFQPDAGLLRMLVLHPGETFGAFEVSGRFALQWAFQHPMPKESFEDRARNRGRLDDPTAALTRCPTEARVHAPQKSWTDGLRTRYGVAGTRVLIDVTPAPECEPTLSFYTPRLAPDQGIVDNRLHTYPVGWYVQSGRMHLGHQGITQLSTEIAAQIQQAGK